MKKNLLWMMAAILTCGFALTACDKDDEEPEIPATPKVATVDVEYKIKIDDATKTSIQKAVTFTVEYYDRDGKLVTIEPLKYGNTVWSLGHTITEFPSIYGIKVTVAPKADLSGISDNDEFDVVYDVLVTGTPKDATGKTLDGVSVRKTTVKYPAMDIKAVAADNEKFVDTFFYTVDANGAISAKLMEGVLD